MQWLASLTIVLALGFSVTPGQGIESTKHSQISTALGQPRPLPIYQMGGLSPDIDLKIGDPAPDFDLDSSTGKPVKLADLKGRWSMLVFDDNRSKLGSLQATADSIRTMGAREYGVCQDGTHAVESYVKRHNLDFTLLSDPTGEVSQVFGMYDGEVGAISSGLVVIDPHGVVRMIAKTPTLTAADVLGIAQGTIPKPALAANLAMPASPAGGIRR